MNGISLDSSNRSEEIFEEVPVSVIPAGYSDKLYNDDLAPLSGAKQNWSWYNIFAFWMSDVHSVGGYVFAGSLFALGLQSWQILLALIVGIVLVQFLCNLVAKPSQQAGVPYPVACRMAFGVFGANVPAVIRGLIAVAWYGIQTYLASKSLDILILWAFPSTESLMHVSFLNLPVLGWISFGVMWTLQALVFWHGMEAIKKFIDWAGPAVYAVMFLLAGWIVHRAGVSNISFTLGEVKFSGIDSILPMITAVALVVSYFSGPMLNFGDFSRYGKDFKEVKKGNFWGLPINFTVFALTTVMITSGTIPVFGEMLTDPIDTVSRIDNVGVMLLGAFTFVTATIGINIVANFVSPAFDFANVSPKHISFRIGGFIAAIGAVFITPWNLFNSPVVIHYTLDMLAAFIGPLFGILLADFYLIRKQKIDVDALYSTQASGTYWYQNGWNRKALIALIPAVLVGVAITLSGLKAVADFNWFIGCGLGFSVYYLLMRRHVLD